jgi:hypothetical protein
MLVWKLIRESHVYVHVTSQTTRQNYYIMSVNKFLKNAAKFKYLRIMVTSQNCIHEESNFE